VLTAGILGLLAGPRQLIHALALDSFPEPHFRVRVPIAGQQFEKHRGIRQGRAGADHQYVETPVGILDEGEQRLLVEHDRFVGMQRLAHPFAEVIHAGCEIVFHRA
jgi:hypothetical protein